MRIYRSDGNGYRITFSADDTYGWAHRPGSSWPGSTVSGKRISASVDSNGLYDISVNGRGDNGEIDGHELEALVADHLPKNLLHLWPTWESAAVASSK